jgi:ParB family chromosome partitioning protein
VSHDDPRRWEEPEAEGEPERVACPLCAEWIRAGARKCRYCGEYVDADERRRRSGLRGWIRRVLKRERAIRYEQVPLKKIRANPFQPREYMDTHSAEFERLKQSIAAFGVIVPIIVHQERSGFILVAGQRRLAASRALKIRSIPALIQQLAHKEMMEVAFLENLHRKDLNRVESSRALQRIVYQDKNDTWRDVAHRFGIGLDEIRAQRMLLKLPVLLQEAVARGLITQEQAAAMGGIEHELVLKAALRETYRKRLSPEEISRFAAQFLKSG